MKADTNNKGNSFWFNFKVSNVTAGQTIQFNVLNFSRDLKDFYNQGMGVYTKIALDETQTWHSDKCFDIEYFHS
jgi:hypothetical protein